VIDIGAMTEMVIPLLASDGVTADLMVGDGVAPNDAGWTTGTPNTGGFVPYTVLGFDGATPVNPDLAKADPEWSTRWSMRHYGATRPQADWVALAARRRILGVLQLPFGVEDPFRTIGITWNSLGPMQRNDTTDPPYWSASDSLILVVSRVRISRP
jgi:hypothetical protein